MGHEYHYMITTVFNRPLSECKIIKPPKNFMLLAFWKYITEEQHKALFMLLNSEDLDIEYKYLVFNNSVRKYNSALQKGRKGRNKNGRNY